MILVVLQQIWTLKISNLENFLEEFQLQNVTKCISIYGLSLANLNLIISIGFIILSIFILKNWKSH